MPLTFGASLAWVVLMTAQAAPPEAPKPAPRKPAAPVITSFDAVLSGKHAAGRAVDFPAILLAPTAIQTTQRGQVRCFVLAVKKDSAYFRGLAAVANELREQGLPKARALATVTKDDAKYRVQVKELDEMINRAIGEKVALLAQVPPAEAVVVEVPGLDTLKGVYNWEDVDPAKPAVPGLSLSTPPPPLLPSLQGYWLEATMRRELLNMTLARPPDLSKKLPDFPASPKLTSERELEAYNATVLMFNAELERRRQYSVQRTEEDVRYFLHRIERFLAMGEQTLPATVSAKVDAAAETYGKILGQAPGAYVKERAKGDAAFVRRGFQSTSLFVTSFPSGAAVKLEAQDLGPTPAIAEDVPVGSKARLLLSRPGFVEKAVEETVVAQPSGTKRIDVGLDPEAEGPVRLMTEAEGKTLFAESFKPARRFSLAVFATSERPGFKGKKDKDGAKRADLIRKAAAAGGWFDLSLNPDSAEVLLEIAVAEAATDKNVRAFRVTYRGEAEEESLSETLSLFDDKAGASRMLHRIAEQLKQRRWKRALGIEG